MSGFYSGLVATAAALIRDKGAPVEWYKATPGAQDADTLKATVSETSITGLSAVRIDLPQREIDGTTVLRGDSKLIVSADKSTFVPEVGDRIVFGSVPARVISPKRLAPAGTVVIWTVIVREGG